MLTVRRLKFYNWTIRGEGDSDRMQQLTQIPNDIVLGPLGLTVKQISYVFVITFRNHATNSCHERFKNPANFRPGATGFGGTPEIGRPELRKYFSGTRS